MNANDERIIDLVVRRHGEVIDLDADPDALIDVLRRFGPLVSAPRPTITRRLYRRLRALARRVVAPVRRRMRARTVVRSPRTAPGPGSVPTNAELMKEVLALGRSVEALRRELAGSRADAAGAAMLEVRP